MLRNLTFKDKALLFVGAMQRAMRDGETNLTREVIGKRDGFKSATSMHYTTNKKVFDKLIQLGIVGNLKDASGYTFKTRFILVKPNEEIELILGAMNDDGRMRKREVEPEVRISKMITESPEKKEKIDEIDEIIEKAVEKVIMEPISEKHFNSALLRKISELEVEKRIFNQKIDNEIESLKNLFI